MNAFSRSPKGALSAPHTSWLAGTVLACVGHLLVAGVLLGHAEIVDPQDDEDGALVVELASQAASVSAAETILPLGAVSQASAESVPQTTSEMQPLEPQVDEVPPLPNVAAADDAERSRQPERPAEEQPEKAVEQKPTQVSAEASEASQAAAPQSIEAPNDQRSAAPVAGSARQASRSKLTWHKSLVVHLDRFKQFPRGASTTGGESLVTFTIDRSGRVQGAALARSSGSVALDAEATAMLARASPLPRPPPEVAGETFTLTVPVVFRNRG